MEDKTIDKLSVMELKSVGFDLMRKINESQMILTAIEAELKRRAAEQVAGNGETDLALVEQ